MSGPAPFFLDLKIRFFSSDTFDWTYRTHLQGVKIWRIRHYCLTLFCLYYILYNIYIVLYYPPITYYWTVPLILDHSYLVGNLTNSKIAETNALEPLKSWHFCISNFRLLISQRNMSGPRLGALSNNRWSEVLYYYFVWHFLKFNLTLLTQFQFNKNKKVKATSIMVSTNIVTICRKSRAISTSSVMAPVNSNLKYIDTVTTLPPGFYSNTLIYEW